MHKVFLKVLPPHLGPRSAVAAAIRKIPNTSGLDPSVSWHWLALCGGIDALIDNLRLVKREYRRQSKSIREHGTVTWKRRK